mgnify:CR=1 FL=1
MFKAVLKVDHTILNVYHVKSKEENRILKDYTGMVEVISFLVFLNDEFIYIDSSYFEEVS